MSPVAQPDGHDAPGLFGQAVPASAAVIDEIVAVAEDSVGQPVVAQALSGVLHDVELGAFRRQWQQGDVVRPDDVAREMPPGPIEQQGGVLAGGDHRADLGEVKVHRGGVAEGQDQDGTEDVDRGVTLVLRCGGPSPATCPPPGDAALLADAGFGGELDLYSVEADALLARGAFGGRLRWGAPRGGLCPASLSARGHSAGENITLSNLNLAAWEDHKCGG